MSKRTNHVSVAVLRRYFIAFSVFCGTALILVVGQMSAQDKGFSTFEGPSEDIESEPVVISAKEAFTNATAKLPKSQFGSFSKPADSKPQLTGSKAIGTYAHEGPGMFRQPPSEVSAQAGKLKPFVGNSLRAEDRPQPDNESIAKGNSPIVVADFPPKKAQAAPPVVVGDFEKSAQRIPSLPKPLRSLAKATNPKVAQVAFQDGGFGGGNRFNPRASQKPTANQNRFDTGAGQSRLNQGATRQGATRQGATRQGATRPRQPLAPSGQLRGQQNAASGFQGLRSRQNDSRPVVQQNRTAALPQTGGFRQQANPQRNLNSGANGAGTNLTGAKGASTNGTSTNGTGTKAAKELLNQWIESGEQSNIPGKQLKLHEFLAQPINGSRKDAINQYWVTFSDMAKHRLAIQHANWLGSIGNPGQQADQAVLKAEQKAAQDRVVVTEIQLTKSQLLLSEYLPNLRDRGGRTVPVLPASIPWVGKLNTKYEEYQKRGIVPAKFNSIDKMLPKVRQLISSEADTVVASVEAVEQAKNAMNSGRAPIANVLEAARIKARSEDQFLATVLGYNRAITDYVLSVRQDIYQPKRLASVLIGRKAVAPASPTLATPEEDTDSLAGSSANPKMRQISTTQQSQRRNGLPGKSAYQNAQNGFGQQPNQPDQQQNLATQQNQQLTSRASGNTQAPVKKATQSFDYGPTAESASAANFDPSKVKEELPMQQFQPKANSGYANSASQVASRPSGNESTGNRATNGISGGQRSAAAPGGSNPLQANKSFNRLSSQNQGATKSNSARGGFQPTGTGGASAPTQPNPSGASGSGGMGGGNPNPFNAKADPTAGGPTVGRVDKAFGGGGSFSPGSTGGGGTFGGGQPSGSTENRFGNTRGSGGSLR